MARRLVLMLVGAGFLCFAGCNIDTDPTSCKTNSGPCSGTFTCENSGIHGFCLKATQVCLVQPGNVGCRNIPGASESACPSVEQAQSVAGCMTGLRETCSGSSSDGITITCN